MINSYSLFLKCHFKVMSLLLGYKLDIDEKLNLLLYAVSQYLVQQLHFSDTLRKIL